MTNVARYNPNVETHYPQIFDAAVLGLESESTPEFPHTLLIEADKLAR